MWWLAALLSGIIWALGLVSGFLGPVIHVFLLLAVLAVALALLPRLDLDLAADDGAEEDGDAPAPSRVLGDGAADAADAPAPKHVTHTHGPG
ncbi:MAG TPA: hypothetical protein VFW96_13255 [Thermomicrobiales bacterium]|nr:hypothetical protein [Thermomicrobiales bacterium]